MVHPRFDLHQLNIFPLSKRKSLTRIEDILSGPDSPPPRAGEFEPSIREAAQRIREARERGASVMMAYGAHLIRNGMGPVLVRMMEEGWITHLATNGAGTIHDWEYSHIGVSTESVRENVATGTFGTWEETGKYINLAVTAGAAEDLGCGGALGRFMHEDGVQLPGVDALKWTIADSPDDPLTPARADLLQFMTQNGISGGRIEVKHPWKEHSPIAAAYRLGVPLTVHPGIGYDIISNHPCFSPAAIGRGAGLDYRAFVQSVLNLSNGVFLSVGSAIMAPQVFEKAMSCANNLLLRSGKRIEGHLIFLVDIQDGGGWDWSHGEPPKTNPAYYLRFCKSFYRMGGEMRYICADNRLVVHNLYAQLKRSARVRVTK